MEVSPLNALAIAVAANLSKRRYVTMQKNMGEQLSRNFPNYDLLAQEKIKCYPAAEDLRITERSAKIKLQALMDLTSKRLLSAIDTSSVDVNQQLILTSQWGFDRSSSHSVCHNKRFQIADDNELVYNFMICVVPLSLVSNGVTIWRNEQPTSLSFCRPILFKFMKDTKANVLAEMATIEAEIEALIPTTLVNGMTVTHQMKFTMIDEEYHPITKETVASVCQICKANAIKTNPHLQSLQRKRANKVVQKYGLSCLHASVRSMEGLLEISYKLDNKTWKEKNIELKLTAMWRKIHISFGLIQKRFVRQPSEQILDCSVYKGTSARQFFEETDYFSDLTKLDFALLRRICVILQTIASGRKIIVPKFREFCLDSAKRYIELYPWYHMPSPLHKLLIHGPDFVENMTIIPIGMVCEDIAEATDIKFKKCSVFNRSSWNEKIFHKVLLGSDPVLASIQPKVKMSSFKEFYILTGSKHEYSEYDSYSHDLHSSLTDDSEDEDISDRTLDSEDEDISDRTLDSEDEDISNRTLDSEDEDISNRTLDSEDENTHSAMSEDSDDESSHSEITEDESNSNSDVTDFIEDGDNGQHRYI